MRTHVFARAFAFLLVAGAVSGCDPFFTPPQPLPDPLPGYPQITASDGLGKWLLVDQPIVQPGGPEGPMRVTVPIRIHDKRRGANIQYAFVFLDQNGRPLNDPSWRFQRLEPRIQVFLDGAAMGLEAVDWRLEIRAAR